jgi:excisionase family DNA binding protein
MKCRACGSEEVEYCADCALVTIREVAERLHVARDTVERWMREGKLHPIRKVYRRVLIRRVEVEALLRGK